jgi:protein TonB
MERHNDQLNWDDPSFHNDSHTVGSALERLSRTRERDNDSNESRKGNQQARMTSPTEVPPPSDPSSSEPPPQQRAAVPVSTENTIRSDEAPHNPGGFLFSGQREKRFSGAMGVSIGLHALAIILALLIINYAPVSVAIATPPEHLPSDVIWLDQRGPGGGGGGGGNQMKEPPRKAELPGKEKITVPIMKAPELTPPKKPEKPPDPVQQLNIPVKTESAGVLPLPGTLMANQSLSLSQGTGAGGGAGTGTGQGIGEGTGSGLGAGVGGGTGGGFYQPGNGVLSPEVVFEKKPNYTPDAMRGRIQGTAWVAAVVLADGTVGEAHIVRSLDSAFGLDEEAIKAVKQWRFRPGTRFGKPVPVQVVIEVSFTMR